MSSSLDFAVIDVDDGLLKVRVKASNGRFSAQSDLYADEESLKEAAAGLDGFPRNSQDAREVTLGAMSAEYAGGGFRMHLSCHDRAGHIEARVTVRADVHVAQDESATFVIPLEAASLDRFVSAIRDLPLRVGATASLVGAA